MYVTGETHFRWAGKPNTHVLINSTTLSNTDKSGAFCQQTVFMLPKRKVVQLLFRTSAYSFAF